MRQRQSKKSNLSTTFRSLLLFSGILLTFPFLGLLVLLPGMPVSPVGVLYLLAYFLMLTGMLFAPWRRQLSLLMLFAGMMIALVTVTIRIIFPPSGARTNLMTLPGATGARLLTRLLDEQDIVLFGAKVAPYLGLVSTQEENSLNISFSQTFEEMKMERVTPLSPFVTTYLNQQKPGRFDAVVSEPVSGSPPTTGVIYLHGFGGSFTVQCWLIASAADSIDAITVCPSTGPVGAWWSRSGEAIVQETIAYLHERGVERIYLVGLSNGAIGASRLADQLKQEVLGLILISGADPAATMTELPVLLLHGKDDERIPAAVMERYASAAPKATYHVFEGDHFLLLKQSDQVQEVIINWLLQEEMSLE